MNKGIASDRSSHPEITDLPPAISAMIDVAMARAAGAGMARRPVVPTARHLPAKDSIPMPAYRLPAKRTRIPAPEDMALVGLFLVIFTACWMTAFLGFNIAKAAENTGIACTAQGPPSSGPANLPGKTLQSPAQGLADKAPVHVDDRSAPPA
jgi:hypothetical protein